ncbi:APC family permease [Nonomuraea cavernae]|uniref:Amino acid permease n=1 Tax=Nonomuraea cavernae TaxID=2045107 RepID=A0A918DF01_9ACTN|nr:APC family permease [Nonomuraea cavernae]MCA2183778.1 APC family permease [Nonomuraea cavernae]GGO61336.1 putative amino acid permease [Nonomuraea cavernae]
MRTGDPDGHAGHRVLPAGRAVATTSGLLSSRRGPKVQLRHGEGDRAHLTSLQGLVALSLDALSSVAYGPEAIAVVLVAAGSAAIGYTLPITIVIALLLVILVTSYCQVIAAYPDGGGSYAVAKQDLGQRVSLLAAAALIVDYVLTVAVSLTAGAASLASAFPVLAPHLLETCLVGLAVLTAVNLYGLADSAKVLLLPTLLFIATILGIVVVGLLRTQPAAMVGTPEPLPAYEAVSVLLILKAFSSGCSALTGVEAIANGVPMFRRPRVRRAQRTELMLGALLATMLVGLAALIRRDSVVPRADVTILAQLTAGAYGTGWLYYAANIIVAFALGLAANTSFGGLPVLMSLLAKDNRLPHLFSLRAERPVHRYGVAAVAITAAVLLIAVDADTQRLIPMFAIGVFIGFTISQVGLVRHWTIRRPPRWVGKVTLNGVGAVITAIAALVLLFSKFTEGAWVVVVVVPLLMLMFSRIQRYYTKVDEALQRGRPQPVPHAPDPASALVIVPISPTHAVSALTEKALSTALAFGHEVIAVAASDSSETTEDIRRRWDDWSPGVGLEVIESPRHLVVRPVIEYVKRKEASGRWLIVVIPGVVPAHPRYRILHTQRDLLLAAGLRDHTKAVVCFSQFQIRV